MTKIQPVSIGNKYKEYFDQLIVCATGNNKSISSEICRAIKFYIQSFEKTPLVANDDKWEDFMNKAKPKEMEDMNRLICEISGNLVKSWKRKTGNT